MGDLHWAWNTIFICSFTGQLVSTRMKPDAEGGSPVGGLCLPPYTFVSAIALPCYFSLGHPFATIFFNYFHFQKCILYLKLTSISNNLKKVQKEDEAF